MNIAIIGSSHTSDKQVVTRAEALGVLLVSKGHVIVTGGVTGYPDIVAQSGVASGGKAIAYCAGKSFEDHSKFYQSDLSKYSKLVFQDKYGWRRTTACNWSLW